MDGIISLEMGCYKNLNIPVPEIIVTDEDLTHGINGFLDPYLKIVPSDEPIKMGDYITISYEIKDEQGDYIPEGRKEHYNARMGQNILVKDFEDHLINLTVGESTDFEMTLPQDYGVMKLQNKNVFVEVSVVEVKRKEAPNLVDQHIQKLSIDGVETVDQLKVLVRQKILSFKVSDQSNHLVNDIIKKVLDQSVVVYDEEVISAFAVSAYDQYVSSASQNQSISLFHGFDESYKADMLEDYKEEARTTLLELAVFETVIEREMIRLEQGEFENALESYSRRVNQPVEEIEVKEFRKSMLYNKVVDLLVKENTV